MPKVEALQSEVAFLKQYILANGIQLPGSGTQGGLEDQSTQFANISFATFGVDGSMLKVSMPGGSNNTSGNALATGLNQLDFSEQQPLIAGDGANQSGGFDNNGDLPAPALL